MSRMFFNWHFNHFLNCLLFCDLLSKNSTFSQKKMCISCKNALKCDGELYACLKKFYACFNRFAIEQSIAKVDITGLPSSWKSLFGVRRVNKIKVTGAYWRCGRNKVFYRNFFIEKDFVSGYANGYWDKDIHWSIWQAIVSAISQIQPS